MFCSEVQLKLSANRSACGGQLAKAGAPEPRSRQSQVDAAEHSLPLHDQVQLTLYYTTTTSALS